jgi:UPF0755 protein
VLVLVLALVGAGLTVSRYVSWCNSASGARTSTVLKVPTGATGDEVIALMKGQGIIRCDLMTRLDLKRRGISLAVQAGNYDMTTNMTPDSAMAVLNKGPLASPGSQANSVSVTIPEGYRLTQIAQVVQQKLGIPAKQFLAAAQSGRFSLSPYLPSGTKTVEGFLYPNTYDFVKGQTTADQVITTMLNQFKTVASHLPWQNAAKLHVTPYQVVSIASMIEREAKIEADRPRISSVIYNRLAKNMPLGIDATLEYMFNEPPGGLTYAQLKTPGPYNTRLHPGLPPTPIASPGLPSLKAALEPAHTDFYYYVLCYPNGGHAFTTTLAQFNALTQRCLG